MGYDTCVEALDDCLSLVSSWIDSATHSPKTFACLNPHSIQVAKSDAHFQYALESADLLIPDGSGIDLIDELNKKQANTMCVVTSIFDDDQHLFAALRAGAKGYVLKDQTQEELATMLKGIIDGKPPLSPAIARRLLNFFTPEMPHVDESQKLTAREQEVLTLISKGYTIAKVGELLGITHNTTASYVKIIYRKLNVNSRAEATLEATRLGIVTPMSR